MGNANEPPKGAPSLELLELKLALAADDDPLMLRAGVTQDAGALAAFQIFSDEHPEVLDKSTFFVTRKAEFKEELAKLTEEQWAAQFEAPTQEPQPEPVKVAAPAPAAPTTKWVTLSKGPNRLFEGFGC